MSLLPFLGVAVLLSILRFIAVTAVPAGGAVGNPQTAPSQAWTYAAMWTAAYFAIGVAGWLLWQGRWASRYGRAALVAYWVQVSLQVLRLVNRLAEQATSGAVQWSAFGTVVVLDLVAVVTALVAYGVSRQASVILWLVFAWLLFITEQTGADSLLRYGLALA